MPINNIPLIMLYCLGSTIVIEGLLALLWGVRRMADQLIVLLVNVLTNPLLVSIGYLILFRFGTTGFNVATAVMEVAVVLVEGWIYKKFLTAEKRPFLLSLFLNAGSFLIGLALNQLIF
ncbi:MAG: hypothetical protein IJT44_01280 [Clostridia bacterium]|nr:hypothetical protein [Clostridia bacterium]